jgi:dTDP-4-dehydrorhamnose reductase
MTGAGEATWAEFAEAIFAASAELGGPRADVKPIRSADYPTSAKRPANSRLDCGKIARIHGVTLPDWRASMKEVLSKPLQSPQEQ